MDAVEGINPIVGALPFVSAVSPLPLIQNSDVPHLIAPGLRVTDSLLELEDVHCDLRGH